jgi:hypothetical protein
MSDHEHENEHALEDEPAGRDDAQADQDSEPSLNAPGDAEPSGVVADDAEEQTP